MSFQLLVNLDVPDFTLAERFYREAFGLTVGRRFGSDGVELLGLGSPIYLLKKAAGSLPFASAAQGRDYARHWCPVHLDVVVPEIEAARTKILSLGAREESAIKVNKWGKIAMFSDPFGHGLCLIEFLGRGYDEIASANG